MRGISFEIQNKYGKQLADVLKEINISRWHWRIGGGEAYVIENGTLGKSLFDPITTLTGDELSKRISENEYYVIFTDLKAFKNVESVIEIDTYEAFLDSDCQFVLLLVDSSYVTIYSKDTTIISSLYNQALAANYENVEYITDENDERITLIAY